MTSAQPVLPDAQQALVLQKDPMAQSQGCYIEVPCQQQREDPVVPLGEQSQQLRDSHEALATQQGQLTSVAAASAAGQQTRSMCISPAGSGGDKENMCQLVAAGPVIT